MQAICLETVGSPLVDCEVPDPVAGSGDVVVRVSAAGICHSDAHYRAGTSRVGFVPIVLGHEVAGVVESLGEDVEAISVGTRVALHYLVGCGHCPHCAAGREAFCDKVQMLGKNRHGGFAEQVVVPASNVIPIPDVVSDEVAAIMMCSTATALHALRKARFCPGDSVAVFGCGGLGISAVHLAAALGAGPVFAVDTSRVKLDRAAAAGAHPVNPNEHDAANTILAATGRRGVDVSLEFVGRPTTVDACIRATGVQGRAAMVALMDVPAPVYIYRDLITREVELIGVSDHLRADAVAVLSLAASGSLRLSNVVTRKVPREARAINDVLDALVSGTGEQRVVVDGTARLVEPRFASQP
jgi:propanol-preferring alcohol dehydrogenase